MTRIVSIDKFQDLVPQWVGSSLDPNAGAGTAAPLGSVWNRAGNYPTVPTETYFKLSSANKGWAKQNLSNLKVFNLTLPPYTAVADSGVTDNGATVRQAIADADAAGGGILYFPAAAGFYGFPFNSISQLSVLPIKNRHNIVFMGDGYASQLQLTGNMQARFQALSVIQDRSSRIAWYNIRVSGNGVTNADAARTSPIIECLADALDVDGPTDIDFDMVWWDPSWGDCLRFLGAPGVGAIKVNDVRVSNCMFNPQGAGGAASFSRSGISTQRNVQRISVTNNWFAPVGTTQQGQQIDFEPGGGDPPTDWVITGNIFNCMNPAAVTLSGIDATHGATRINFSRNILRGEDAGSTGASLEAVNRPTDCIIHGNIILMGPPTNTGFNPIEFRIATDCLFTDNIAVSQSAAATRGAIFIFEDGGQFPSGCIIDGNLCKCVAAAANVPALSCHAMTQFHCNGNLIFMDCGTSVGSAGVEIRSTSRVVDDLVCSGNLIVATSAQAFLAGIYFSTAAPGFAQHNIECWGNLCVKTTDGILFDSSGAAFVDFRMAGANNCPTASSISLLGPGTNVGVSVCGSTGKGCGIVTQNLAAGPAGLVSAAPGCMTSNTAGAQATCLFLKESGTGTAGWVNVGAFEYTFGTQAVGTATAARFWAPGIDLAAEGTVEIKVAAVRPGTLRNLRIKAQTAGTGGGNNTYRVRKNGADTNLAVTVANTAVTGSNVANVFTVVAGDLLSVDVTKTVAPTTAPTFITATFEMI